MAIKKTFVPPSQGDNTPDRKFRVDIPEAFAAWCMRAITTRKGSIDRIDNQAGRATITALIPSSMYGEVVRELGAFGVFTSLD